jgi:hypothetical protein
MMTLRAAVTAVLVMSLADVCEAQAVSTFGGRLYRSVSDRSIKSPLHNSDRDKVPVSLRPRFDRFVRCRAVFTSALPVSKMAREQGDFGHHSTLERALTCLFPEHGIAATEYARRAELYYEWEGLSSSPIGEADHAETYIAEHPASPFVPYLYVFAAERWRCAFEFYVRDRDAEGIAESAAKYRDLVARARTADSLIQLIADDMDGLRFLSSDVGKHPRDPY